MNTLKESPPKTLTTLGALLLALGAAAADTGKTIVLETAAFRYVIGAEARNVAFVDRATGSNYLRGGPSPCALARTAGGTLPATSAARARGRLTLRFGDTGIQAVLKTEARPTHISFTVESVTGEVEALTFLNVPLALQGSPA
jgi:hypothetical protein